MEKYKIEYIFGLEDFKVMENIEHSYFQNDNITPAEEVLNWYNKIILHIFIIYINR